MISRNFLPKIFAKNFLGVNSKDTEENQQDGEWSEDSINIFSDPQGSVGSRPGYSQLTSASIGSATDWCGFYQFDVHSGGSTTPHYIGGGSDGKVYEYISNGYTQLYTGLSTTNDDDERFSFFSFDNTCIILQSLAAPLAYTGTGSAATFATSVTGDWGLEWQRYGWIHSTVDPRLLYYCATLGDPDSAYTSNLNFDEDAGKLTGGCKQADDMILGKEGGLWRVQYRGTTPLFAKYRIPSKVGPVNHQVMKEIPDGRVVFLAPDFNFYMLIGNNVVPAGDNIKKYMQASVAARLKYAVAGLLLNRSQYWCSFTYTSGATQNDRTVVMDWSRPYVDKWGKIQYPWFIYSIGANCFAEVTVSGQTLLYHGGYAGKMFKNDTGTNDNGTTFTASYNKKLISHGDPTLEKKYDYLTLAFANKGNWNLDIQITCDGNANTEKIITQSMLGGLGAQNLWDNFNWDEANWSSVTDIDVTREIGRQGKVFDITMSTDAVDEAFLIYYWVIHAKPLRRAIRTRES